MNAASQVLKKKWAPFLLRGFENYFKFLGPPKRQGLQSSDMAWI